MTKFENPSFGSGANSNAYREGWEKTFGKKNSVRKCCYCEHNLNPLSSAPYCSKCEEEIIQEDMSFGKPSKGRCTSCGGIKLDSSNSAMCKMCLAEQISKIRVDHADDCTLHENVGTCSKSCNVWVEE